MATIGLVFDLSGCDTDGNGFLVASEDDDTATATDLDCSATVTPTFGGGTWTATADIWDLEADMAVGTQQDLGTLTSGTAASIAVSLPFSDRKQYEIRVSATDTSDTVDASASFYVDTVAPTITPAQPTEGQTLNIGDDNSATPGFQVALTFQVDVETGVMGSVEIAGADTQSAPGPARSS